MVFCYRRAVRLIQGSGMEVGASERMSEPDPDDGPPQMSLWLPRERSSSSKASVPASSGTWSHGLLTWSALCGDAWYWLPLLIWVIHFCRVTSTSYVPTLACTCIYSSRKKQPRPHGDQRMKTGDKARIGYRTGSTYSGAGGAC